MVFCDISMSLDGYVAGPDQTLDEPLGCGGERLHDWAVRLKSFRERHGMPGGETGVDDDVVREWQQRSGAVVMGRRMFSGGSGPWEADPNAGGWWATTRRSTRRCSC
jgi:dihydrofolate reductase